MQKRKSTRLSFALGFFLMIAGFLPAISQVTVQVGTGTTGNANIPMNTNWGYNYSQQIYTAAEIIAAGGYAGNITKLRFNITTTNVPANCNGWTVYVAQSARTQFSSNTDWEPIASFTQVFSGNVVFGTNWIEVTFSAPFTWNGTSNLIVALDENTPNFDISYNWNTTTTGSNRSIYYRNDSNDPNPASPPTAVGRVAAVPNIQFVFAQTPCAGVPAPGNTLASSSAVCVGGSSNLSLQNNYVPISGITYQWQQFNGTAWVNIPSATGITYAITNLTATTDYRARLICNGTDTGYSNLTTVVANPLPNISISPASSVTCASEAVTLTANGADTYTWTPNTNLSATIGATVNSTAAAVLTYTVTGTTTATGCSNIATALVTPITALPITVASTPAVVCTQGQPVTLNGVSPVNISGGGQVEYQWLDSAGTTVLQDWTTTGYTFTPSNIGTYRFNVKARISSCPANISPTKAFSISAGFDGDVVVNDVYCGQTTGSINVTNALGPLTSGTWYENTFSTTNLNPTQIQLFGNSASITGGKLILTPNLISKNGGAIIYNPNNINPRSMELTFDLTVGGGPNNATGADGMSWSFGPDVVGIPAGTGDGVGTLNAETGSGTGLKIGFDAYGSGFPNQAGIYLMYNCTEYDMQLNTPGLIQYLNDLTWKGTTKNITITIDDLGKLTMKFGTTVIFNNVQLPAAYVNADKSTWKHAFSARTGGVSMNHEIDNIKIVYTKTDVVYGIAAPGNLPSSWQAGSTFTGLAIGSYDVYVASGANAASCNKLLGTYALNDSITPAPGNAYTSVASVCSNTNTAVNLTLQDTYSAYAGITYQWQSFDGTDWVDIANATNSSYSFNGLAQTTDFRAKVSCDTNFTGISNLVTVISVDPPTISVTPNAVTLCTGETPTLTASGADTYVWSPNIGLNTTVGASVTANPTAYQEYTVTGTTTATGCSNIGTAYVTPIQLFPIQASPTSTICSSGVPVTLQVDNIPDYAAGFGTLEYQWLDSTGAEVQAWGADSTFTFTPATEGFYSYFVKMRSTGCSDVPDSTKIDFYVGFGGNVSTIDINCYIPTGTISISDYFGQGDAGVWFSSNFPGTPIPATQATLHQNASLTGGRMVLTPSATGNKGGFTILNPNNISGTNVQYDITFKMTADQPINTFGTGGADGIAYSFGPDANYSNTIGNPCAGFGSKLRISFDAANNSTDNGNATGIYLAYGFTGTGQIGPVMPTTLAYNPDLSTWKLLTDVPVHIVITVDGKLTMTVGTTTIFSNIQLPSDFVTADKTTWKHLFSSQTGGDAMRQAIDDVNIKYSALNFGINTAGATNLPATWQNTPIFTGLTAGDYDVYISDVNDTNCNKNLGTFSIIDRNPHVDFPTDTILCAGASLLLDAGNEGSYYEWSTGEVGTDEQFYTVTTAGTYTVNVTDTIGCEALGFISVSGSALPVISLGADTAICSGSSFTLDAGTDGESYLWNDNTTNQTLDVNVAGNYSVTVTNDDGCTNSDAITVSVLNAPSISSLGTTVNGQSVAFAAQTPQNVNTYEWNFGDGNTITTLSPNINYNYANCGTYTATVTVQNTANCGTDNATATVSFECTGIEENDANKGLNVYPNPARDFIAIANPNGLTIEKVTMYDAAGKQLFQSTNASNLVPDITAFAPGIYLVKIDAAGETFVQRIIIGR